MGFFSVDPLNEIFEDYDREDCEDILETARAISGNDRRVVAAVETALGNPKKYIKRNAARFDERGLDIADEQLADELDADELLFLAMLDELEALDYVFEFDYKCSSEDFLWGLTQLKTYDLIRDAIKTAELDEGGNIEKWGKTINGALGGKAYLCYISIDSDSYPLAVVTPEAFERIPIPFVLVM